LPQNSGESAILEGKHASKDAYKGTIARMTAKIAEIQTDVMAEKLTNLKISLFENGGAEITSDLYAKVTEIISESPPTFKVNFTSVPPEAEVFLEKILASQRQK